jgi:hypothetical protein
MVWVVEDTPVCKGLLMFFLELPLSNSGVKLQKGFHITKLFGDYFTPFFKIAFKKKLIASARFTISVYNVRDVPPL